MNTVRTRSGPLITIKSIIMNAEIVRYKLIKRIVKYCEIYTINNLSSLSTLELLEIQNNCLIKLKIKAIFRTRHVKSE